MISEEILVKIKKEIKETFRTVAHSSTLVLYGSRLIQTIDHLTSIMPKMGATCEHYDGDPCTKGEGRCLASLAWGGIWCGDDCICRNDKWKLKELKGKG